MRDVVEKRPSASLLRVVVKICFLFYLTPTLFAQEISLQTIAFAPNAGGQESYALRYSLEPGMEFFAFSNKYLMTGVLPLSGGGLGWRFGETTSLHPYLRSFLQLGGGVSTAGPFAEILWDLTIFSMLRIDVGSHMYIPSERPIFWSYPFWAGLTVMF